MKLLCRKFSSMKDFWCKAHVIQPCGLDGAELGFVKGLHMVGGYLLLERPLLVVGLW